MNRASPADLRKAMEIAQLLLRAGIDFVPVPVLDQEQKDAAVADLNRRLEILNKKGTEP